MKLTIPCSLFKRCTLRNGKVVIFCRHHTRFQKPDLSPSHLSTLTSRSHHPTLYKLHGASQSEDPNHIYMVYEDIPGATLKECLQTPTTPLSNWMWRMQVALDLAQGLECIHHHCGMVHNIIMSSSVQCLHHSLYYMAPEVSRGRIISQKFDAYAIGVVILELISGKRPGKWKENRVKWREGEPKDEELRRRVMQFVDS